MGERNIGKSQSEVEWNRENMRIMGLPSLLLKSSITWYTQGLNGLGWLKSIGTVQFVLVYVFQTSV